MEFILAFTVCLLFCIPLFYGIVLFGRAIEWTANTVTDVQVKWINFCHQRRMSEITKAKENLTVMLNKLNATLSLDPEILEAEVKIQNLLNQLPELEQKARSTYGWQLRLATAGHGF